jgi:hypothetical protein
MKIALPLVVIGLIGCGSSTGSGPSEPAAGASPPSATNPQPPPAPPSQVGNWLLEAPGVGGMFQSPAPDDIWAGKYHRVNGEWVLPFRMSGNLVWVASPTEVWTLETNTSLLHVWTPSGQTVMDLSRPARAYTALRDGWIAYYEPRTDGCVVCDGNIGFVRATASDFVDVPVPAARWSVTTILENVAVTERGEVLLGRHCVVD